MREIKFRGKRLDNGEWVYGGLVCCKHRAWIKDIRDEFTNPRRISGISADFRCIEIDPDTVGQYTGLKDKNGVEICGGDILKTIANGQKFIGPVYYEDAQWFGGRDYLGYAVVYSGAEVIGNRWDNPDLLEDANGN